MTILYYSVCDAIAREHVDVRNELDVDVAEVDQEKGDRNDPGEDELLGVGEVVKDARSAGQREADNGEKKGRDADLVCEGVWKTARGDT